MSHKNKGFKCGLHNTDNRGPTLTVRLLVAVELKRLEQSVNRDRVGSLQQALHIAGPLQESDLHLGPLSQPANHLRS